MSGQNELLALALDGIAAQLEADSEDAFQRSRRLRARGEEAAEGEPESEQEQSASEGDDYEIGYAEGRASALGRSARDLRNTTAAIRALT